MFDWIVANYKIIITAFIAMVDVTILVISIFKRNPKIIDSAFERLIEKIPEFINSAEKSGLTGQEKFQLCLSSCVSFLSAISGQSTSFVSSHYLDRISDAIELILSTPQKKEVHNG